MTSKRPKWLLLILFIGGTVQGQESFPQPAELQPDVDFWVQIFTRYSSDQGVLHDSENVAIVYEHIDFPPKLGRRDRQRIVGKRRKHLQRVLRNLAASKRENLNADEERLLALWPADVSNKTLAAAARHIRHQLGLKDRFRDGLQRAGRWRDYIDTEFRALGVPVELAALPHVESSYNPDARSHIGASGIWQFTRSTGRRFMRVDHVVDERNDPYAATRAAGKLLAYNYSITGNWPMAITAYNHGLAGVRRAMRQYGDTAYVEILRHYKGRTFGFASRNFYVAFLAAKHVDQQVEQYFPSLRIERPTEFVELTLDAYISADELCKALGVTARQLSAHNPALQATVWTGSKHLPKGYKIRLPRSKLDDSMSNLVAAIPAVSWQSEQLPDMFHTVARGDTLSQIAALYKTRVSTLVALNSLRSSNRIRAGQRLRLPAAGPAPTAMAAVSTPVVAMAEGDTEASTLIEPAAEPGAEDLTPSVVAGDLMAGEVDGVQTTLLSDPNDYSVDSNNTIEVHPLETLGHYADWLAIRTQRLRDINGLAFRTPVEVGNRIRLDLSKVDAKNFEDRRIAYHRAQQDNYFRRHVITGVTEHVIRSGESIWILSLRKYDVPIWLFRQYNAETNLHNVRPGTTVRFPLMTAVEPT